MKVRSEREPILLGPHPRVHFTPADDPDTAATAAAPTQETAPGRTTTPIAEERARIRLAETEAEGAPPVQRTKTSSAPATTTTEDNLSDQQQHLRQEHLLSELETRLAEDSQPVHRCVELQHSWLSARNHTYQTTLLKRDERTWRNSQKSRTQIIKVVPRTDATTKPLTGRWVDTVHDDGARKARWTTRGYEQTLNGNEDFFSATP